MPISIQLRTVEGDVRRTIDVPHECHFLTLTKSVEFPLLRWVSRWGETWFSRVQMQGLIPELKSLLELCASSPDHEVLEQVLDMAKECRNLPHWFVVFIGD